MNHNVFGDIAASRQAEFRADAQRHRLRGAARAEARAARLAARAARLQEHARRLAALPRAARA